jgi:hypothetical protein
MTTTFKDYFSKQANDYARYRPSYPHALFEFLADVAYAHEAAWDCATGNGQVALGLAPHFHRIYATGTGSAGWDGYNHYPEGVRLHIELLVVATKIIQLPEFLALQQEQL